MLATDATWFVCVSVVFVCAKTAEPIEISFEVRTLASPRKRVLCGGGSPKQKRGNFGGVSPGPGPLQSIGNIGHEPKLFGRLQLRCGLSLSLLQQLVINLRRHAWHKMGPTVTYLRSVVSVSVC